MLEIDLPEGLRQATAADWRQMGDITGEAFETDPVNLWIFGHTHALKPTFSLLAQALYLKHGICHLAGDGGATMWIESQNRRELEKQGVELTVVGRVTDAAAGRWLRLTDGRRVPLRGGYNHFNG